MPMKFSSEFLGSESTYGMVDNRVGMMRRGAPTPTGKRKNLLPEVTKLMSAVDPTGALSDNSVSGTVGSKFGSRDSVGAASAARQRAARRLASQDADTWTLKVDRMDITKLRHELESANVREKIAALEKAMLGESQGLAQL